MAETIADPENLRELIRERIEAEVKSELAREQRKAALEADPEWAEIDAQFKALFERKDEVEKRVSATICESFGGHVRRFDLFGSSN